MQQLKDLQFGTYVLSGYYANCATNFVFDSETKTRFNGQTYFRDNVYVGGDSGLVVYFGTANDCGSVQVNFNDEVAFNGNSVWYDKDTNVYFGDSCGCAGCGEVLFHENANFLEDVAFNGNCVVFDSDTIVDIGCYGYLGCGEVHVNVPTYFSRSTNFSAPININCDITFSNDTNVYVGYNNQYNCGEFYVYKDEHHGGIEYHGCTEYHYGNEKHYYIRVVDPSNSCNCVMLDYANLKSHGF